MPEPNDGTPSTTSLAIQSRAVSRRSLDTSKALSRELKRSNYSFSIDDHQHQERKQVDSTMRARSLEFSDHEDTAWLTQLKKDLQKRKVEMIKQEESSKGHWLVDSNLFNVVIGFFVILNTIQMGAETQWPNHENVWKMCESIFTALFLVEMMIKLFFLRCTYFCDPANWLDCFIVTVSIIDCWILPVVFGAASPGMQSLSVLRVLRLARLVRVLRLIKHVRQLVVVIRGVVDAIMTTFWVACVVFLTVYVGAIFCTEYIGRGTQSMYPGYATDEASIEDQETMANFNPYLAFGNMPKSMFTLFNLAIMAEWVEVVRPVSIKQPELTVFFIGFAMFVTFGVMNVMVGMIVDNVSKEKDRLEDEEEQRERDRKLTVLADLKQIIFNIDVDKDGLVSVEELAEVMRAEREAIERRESGLDSEMDVGEAKSNGGVARGKSQSEDGIEREKNQSEDEESQFLEDVDNRAESLAMCLERLGPPDGITPQELLCMLDNDGDGKLRYDEFTKSFYRLIESNDFQRICLIQIGINHVKNLIKCMIQKDQEAMSGLDRQIKALHADIRHKGVASCRTEKEEKDGSFSERDSLATLIKDVQKSISTIDRKMYDLRQDLQVINKEIRDQKYAARCQSSRWEKEERMAMQDHLLGSPASPRNNVHEGRSSESSEEDARSPSPVPENRKLGSSVPMEEEKLVRFASDAIAERDVQLSRDIWQSARNLSEDAAGPACTGQPQNSTVQPLVSSGTLSSGTLSSTASEYLDAVVRNVGHKVQQNICGIAGCLPVDSAYTPLGNARGDDSQRRPRIAGIALDGDLNFYFDQEGVQLGITLGKWGDNQTCLEQYPQIIKVDRDSEGSRRGLMVDDRIVTCNDRSPLGMSRQGFLDMMKKRPLQLTLERPKALKAAAQPVLAPQEDGTDAEARRAAEAAAEALASSRGMRGEGEWH